MTAVLLTPALLTQLRDFRHSEFVWQERRVLYGAGRRNCLSWLGGNLMSSKAIWSGAAFHAVVVLLYA